MSAEKPFQAPTTPQEEKIILKETMHDALGAHANLTAAAAENLEKYKTHLAHQQALLDARRENPVVPPGEKTVEELTETIAALKTIIERSEQELVALREELDVTQANHEDSEEKFRKSLH